MIIKSFFLSYNGVRLKMNMKNLDDSGVTSRYKFSNRNRQYPILAFDSASSLPLNGAVPDNMM